MRTMNKEHAMVLFITVQHCKHPGTPETAEGNYSVTEDEGPGSHQNSCYNEIVNDLGNFSWIVKQRNMI